MLKEVNYNFAGNVESLSDRDSKELSFLVEIEKVKIKMLTCLDGFINLSIGIDDNGRFRIYDNLYKSTGKIDKGAIMNVNIRNEKLDLIPQNHYGKVVLRVTPKNEESLKKDFGASTHHVTFEDSAGKNNYVGRAWDKAIYKGIRNNKDISKAGSKGFAGNAYSKEYFVGEMTIEPDRSGNDLARLSVDANKFINTPESLNNNSYINAVWVENNPNRYLLYTDKFKNDYKADFTFKVDRRIVLDHRPDKDGNLVFYSSKKKPESVLDDKANMNVYLLDKENQRVFIGKGFSRDYMTWLNKELNYSSQTEINNVKNIFTSIRDNNLRQLRFLVDTLKTPLDFTFNKIYDHNEHNMLTPLSFATVLRRDEISRYIIEKVSNKMLVRESQPRMLSFPNKATAERLPENLKEKYYENPGSYNVYFAILDNDLEKLKYITENTAMDLEVPFPKELTDHFIDMAFTPLEYAASMNNVEAFNILIQGGAGMHNYKIDDGLKGKERVHDPLEVAINNNSKDILKLYVENHPEMITKKHFNMAVSASLHNDKNPMELLSDSFIRNGLADKKIISQVPKGKTKSRGFSM